MSENGVWRTIRGAKVFIGDGESLDDALARREKEIQKNKEVADKLNGKKPERVRTEEEEEYKKKYEEAEAKREERRKNWHDKSPRKTAGDEIYGYHKETIRDKERVVRDYDEASQIHLWNERINATPEQKEALKEYAVGQYQSEDEGSKARLAEKYKLSDVIEKNEDLHVSNATLYRGADLSDKDYQSILSGNANIGYFKGLTSWSLGEDVAHMYAQGDSNYGQTYRSMHGDNSQGHRVVFIETGTNDAMALPHSSQEEVLRSERRAYTIEKVIPEEKYEQIPTRGGYMGYYKEPVTYVYVKSTRR